VESIYQIPLIFKEQSLDKIILKHFNLRPAFTDLKNWKTDVVDRALKPVHNVSIAVVENT